MDASTLANAARTATPRDAWRSLPAMIRSGHYRRGWLRPDLLAGLTVAAMLVPQAMAYAELGGLPPSAGFRAALVALPVYAVLGTSRHLGVGPEPGTAVLSAVAIGPLANGDPERYVALMAALAVMVGAISLLAGALRLGYVASLLSKPVLVGYITGVGLTLLSSQLSAFTGIPITADGFVGRFSTLFRHLGESDGATFAVGVGVLAIIMTLRHYRPGLPGALIGLAASIVAVSVFGLEVAVVGEIDAALPSFAVPRLVPGDLVDLAPVAAGVALIGYTDNILTARAVAAKQGYEVGADRELVALGAMNVASGFAGGFPVSSSASRSFVPATLGSRSQLSSLVTVVAVILFLSLGSATLAEIPRPALAAVIVAAALAVIDIDGFGHLVAISRGEAALAAITTLCVVTTDLLFGVLLAVALSMVITLGRVARPHDAILGEGEGLDGWISIDDHEATPLPGLLVYRFDAPLFYANAAYFHQRLRSALVESPGPERAVILDFEGIGSVDTTAIEQVAELCEELAEEGIMVSLARTNRPVRVVLDRSGLTDRIGPERIFPTINAAVAAFRQADGIRKQEQNDQLRSQHG